MWAGHALYVGPSLALQPHSTAVSVMVTGVGADVEVRAAGHTCVGRTVLIPPRTIHRVSTASTVAFCYFDAGSRRVQRCRDAMSQIEGPLALHHVREKEILRTLRASPIDPVTVLDVAAGADSIADERIAQATASLRAHPGHDYSAADLAAQVHLSTSRFLQLFAAHTGTSFRRYRLWTRMCRVGESIAKGGDLTTAAVDAGFASPSHFSDTFHAMFGLSASTLLASGATLVVGD
ncbi:helix-turn-helix transcriptional regulator [Gordonia sp. TBRC 11910]|uniref:Helix-turn-helix transcriptional regulator n=1 Tax=Gordonia asplenii TaxID=2725283 RepID=A0A848KTN5_9ACTN|nr:helix-turn-helix transcriptional regulator [Gordonia asplenii]